MPYRHAHFYLLLLFPLTGLAFWPNYFSVLRTAPAAFHVHGITASLWILLLALQSWSIHQRRNPLHRSLGYGSFLLFPLFLSGGLLVVHSMAVKVGAGTNPFYALFGARLGSLDILSSVASAWLFYMALKCRRQVQLHARYMLATAFFLIAPIVSRLLPILPPLAIAGPQDMHHFSIAVHIANLAAAAFAAGLYLKAPKYGRPFLAVGTLILVQSLLFEAMARVPGWDRLYARLGEVPPPLIFAIGLAAGAATVYGGWNAGRSPPRRLATA